MFSLLNVFNSSKSEEFNLKKIEVLVDSEVHNWFKRTNVGKFWGIENIQTPLIGLEKCEMLTRQELEPTRRTTDKFLPVYGVIYVIVKHLKSTSQKTLYHAGLIQGLKRSKNSIDKPSKNKTTGYWLSNMRKWPCKHREIFIRQL